MRFKIHTLGCKVNQYESQAMREFLAARGFSEVLKGPADLYIVNSCTVTHTADAKSLKFIRRSKAENPQGTVIATGCLAQGPKAPIKESGADHVIGQRQKSKVFSLFDKSISPEPDDWLFKIKGSFRNRAFVKVQDGCDNLCSFCKVRLVRGRSRSRPYQQVLAEVLRLSQAGFYELVLCGIDLGSFSYGGKNLIGLLRDILKLKDIGRVRLSSLESGHISRELIYLFAQDKRLCPHFHIPFQSGSTKVLTAMNKTIDAVSYFRLIENIRKGIPDCGISCDIMVGFPGEEDEDFKQTLKLIDFCQPVRTHIFPYSRRPGTKSSGLRSLGPKKVKERLARAQQTAKSASFKFRKTYENKVFKVILDSNALDSRMLGYTANYIRVAVNDLPVRPRPRSLKQPLAVKILTTDFQYSRGAIVK